MVSNTEVLPDSKDRIKKRAEMAVEESTGSINAASIALMLERINQKLIELTKFYDVKTPANAVSTRKRLPTAKPSIDIVNDYYPFVNFKFVFPEISPNVKKTPDIFMIMALKANSYENDTIRETWGNRSSEVFESDKTRTVSILTGSKNFSCWELGDKNYFQNITLV